MNPRLALLSACLLAGSLQAGEPAQPEQATAIPFAQLGAEAQKQYSGDGIGVTPTARGARLRAAFQKLEAEATQEGLWIESTETPGTPDRFRVRAMKVGQASSLPEQPGRLRQLPAIGTVHTTGEAAAWSRPGLTEEYSASMDGIRQDFVVSERPAGEGGLRLELEVNGARAEAASYGAKLTLDGSGRELAYSRLHVTDAGGKTLTTRLEVTATDRLVITVDDNTAVYPVRIDPTFSDADWIGDWGTLGSNGVILAIVADDAGNLYLGGNFTAVGNLLANRVAKWDGSDWSALGSGMDGPVRALVESGGDLYAAGTFTTAGGVSANNIAKWDGSAWEPLGSGLNNGVNALVLSGSAIYAGGAFTEAGSVSANYIAKWDDGDWSALGSGLDSNVSALAISNGTLYVGGHFTTAGGEAANYIAKWDGSAWSSLGSGMSSVVSALAVNETDLYAGGSFTEADGESVHYIAKWDGNALNDPDPESGGVTLGAPSP